MFKDHKELSLQVGEQIENACRGARKSNVRSWVPIGLGDLWGAVLHGEKLGLIHPGQTVLDMGSGSGSSSLLWAYQGYNVIGIEISQKLARSSKEAVRKCQNLMKDGLEVRIFNGSYYPKSYIEKREKRKSIAEKIEKEYFGHSRNHKSEIFFPVCKEDVYKKNKIEMKSIDVFYAYIWGVQGPSIMEVFKDYARDDTILCIIGRIDEEHIRKIGLFPAVDDAYSYTQYITKGVFF